MSKTNFNPCSKTNYSFILRICKALPNTVNKPNPNHKPKPRSQTNPRTNSNPNNKCSPSFYLKTITNSNINLRNDSNIVSSPNLDPYSTLNLTLILDIYLNCPLLYTNPGLNITMTLTLISELNLKLSLSLRLT